MILERERERDVCVFVSGCVVREGGVERGLPSRDREKGDDNTFMSVGAACACRGMKERQYKMCHSTKSRSLYLQSRAPPPL